MNGNKRDINKNIKITLLSSKDLFKKENNLIISNNLTNTFKNIGIRSAASDLALINGSFAIDEEYVDCNQRLNNRSVSYYLKNNYGSYNLLITEKTLTPNLSAILFKHSSDQQVYIL